jgi:CheY-like chemotaxis protein
MCCSSGRSSRGYVLIVDDDRAIRETLADVLGDEGYEVGTAADGQEALAVCRSAPPPGLILLDLQMPVMDGLEFARLKGCDESLSQIPFCVMTASGASASIPPGAAAVLRKPVGIAEVVARRAVRLIACFGISAP